MSVFEQMDWQNNSYSRARIAKIHQDKINESKKSDVTKFLESKESNLLGSIELPF